MPGTAEPPGSRHGPCTASAAALGAQAPSGALTRPHALEPSRERNVTARRGGLGGSSAASSWKRRKKGEARRRQGGGPPLSPLPSFPSSLSSCRRCLGTVGHP